LGRAWKSGQLTQGTAAFVLLTILSSAQGRSRPSSTRRGPCSTTSRSAIGSLHPRARHQDPQCGRQPWVEGAGCGGLREAGAGGGVLSEGRGDGAAELAATRGPCSPIFRNLENFLQAEEFLEDCGVSEVLQFAGSSQWVLTKDDGGCSFCCKVLAGNCEELL